MTLLETSRQLGYHYFSTWRLIQSGAIKATRIGKVFHISPTAIEEYLKNKRPAGRPRKQTV